MLKFACPECAASFAGDVKQIGRRFKCPKCSHEFRIQAADGAASSTAASPGSVKSKPSPARPAASVAPAPAAARVPAVEVTFTKPRASGNTGKRIAVGAAAGLGVLAAVVTFIIMSGGDPQGTTTPAAPTNTDPNHAVVPGTSTQPTPAQPRPTPVEWRIPAGVEPVARESLQLAMQSLGTGQAQLPPDTAIALATLHARLGDAAEMKRILESSAEPKEYDLYSAESPEPYGVRAARVAAEAQDSALALKMFDRALEDMKVIGRYPQADRVFPNFFYLLRAQLELGDLAGAKATVDAWRRMPASFTESGQSQIALASNLLLAGTLGDLNELEALMTTAPKTEGRVTIDTWVLRRLVEAKQFDAAVFLVTDPRTTHWIMAQFDAGIIVRAVLATGDIEGAIRMAEGLRPRADMQMGESRSQGWDAVVAALAAKGELDRALTYTKELEPGFERAMATAMIAPYFAKAGRLEEIRNLPQGKTPDNNLVAAVLARLDGDAARYKELMDPSIRNQPGSLHERIASVLLNLGDAEGAGRILANRSLWNHHMYRHGKLALSERPAHHAFAKAGSFDSFLDVLTTDIAQYNDRNTGRYWSFELMLPAAAAAGKSAKALELINNGGFLELMPGIVAAQAGAGDVTGARAGIASIDNMKETFGHTKPMLRAKAHAQIGLALIPVPRPPISLAGGRPGMATLDLPAGQRGLARLTIPAKPDLPGIIALAQQHILDKAGDNAILLAHLARLQLELGDKDGAAQSLARAQQTATIAPDPASRVEGFFQIAMTRAAGGDAEGARSALAGCIDATALLESRHARMDALVALHLRLWTKKETKWAEVIADGAAQVAGDLNDSRLQTHLARLRIKSGKVEAVATIVQRYNLAQFLRDDELLRALADLKDIARIKQFRETVKGQDLTNNLWPGVALAMARKGDRALAKEAMALVPHYITGEYVRLVQLLADAGEDDDYVLATYDKLLPEFEKETPRGTRYALLLAQRRSQLDRAAARTLVRKGKVKDVRAYYNPNTGAELSYLQVLEVLAPLVFKVGDKALYAELLADFKAHYDKVEPGNGPLQLKLQSLAALAKEQFAMGDSAGGNASIDMALATGGFHGVLGKSLETLLVTAGRMEEAKKWFPPTSPPTPVPAPPTAGFDTLLAAGKFAQAQRVAIQNNERGRYVEAVAAQARAGDLEGAIKAVTALSPVAWRGHVPYAILAIGQGLVARDRLASIEPVTAPAKIELITNLPATAAQPGNTLQLPRTPGAPDPVYLNKDDPATVEGWIAMLDDPNANRRGMGIKLLQNAGAKSFPGIKRLGQLARSDPSSIIRKSAEDAANSIHEAANSALMSTQVDTPEPAPAMGKRWGEMVIDRSIRRALRHRMLERIGTWSTSIQPQFIPAAALALCQGLDDVDDGERFARVVGMWATIKDADPAALKIALAHQNADIRAAAMHAMLKGIEGYRPPGSTSALDRHRVMLLASPYPDVREAGLTDIREVSVEAFPLIVGMMKTTDIDTRAKVAVMLVITPRKPVPDDFEKEHAEAAAILVEATKDADFATRKAATIVARSLKLVPTPPAAQPQPEPQPRPTKDAVRNPRPQPRPAPSAPDEVVIGNRALALTEAVTPALINQVMSRKDQSLETKRMFANIYGSYGNQQASEAMIPYLPALLAEDDHNLLFTLGNTLSRETLGPKVPAKQREAIIKALKDAVRRHPSVSGTGEISNPMVQAVNKLQSPPDDERFRFDKPTFKNNNEARTVLRKGDAGMNQTSQAIQFLRNAKANDGDTMGALIAALDHGNTHIRSSAAEYLGELGPPAVAALNPLMKAYKDEVDPQTRPRIARAIFAIGPDSPLVEQISLELLSRRNGPDSGRESNTHKMIAASKNLRLLEFDIEARWRETVERLDKPYLFDQRQPFPQSGLFPHYYESMPPEELKKLTVPQVILDALKSPQIDTRAQALDVINRLRYAADSAAPHVVALLKDDERDIQHAAIFALEWMERGEDLAALLNSEDDLHRKYAGEALHRLGPKAAASLPALEEKLKAPNLPLEQKQNLERLIARIKEPPRNPRQPPR